MTTEVPEKTDAAPPARLSGHRNFRLLWGGDAISQLGSRLSELALPVLAVEAFNSGEFEMGILTACGTIAFLLVGLPSGAWVDRMRTKPVLVVSDLLRALALVSLPLALMFDVATFAQLCIVSVLVGTCSVFFDVAWQGMLPRIVDRDQLVEGNAKLSATQSVAEVAGPAAGGQLLRLLGAPAVIAIDAVSFVASALFVSRIQVEEQVRDRVDRRPLRTEVAEGLRFVLGNPVLRRVVTCTALANFAGSMFGALFVLFALRDLDLGQGMLGLVYALGAVGGLVGAFSAERVTRALGEARTIPLSVFVGVPGLAFIPIALHAPGHPAAWFITGWVLSTWGGVVYNVTQVSYRQRMCPPELLGRMNASVRFLVWGVLPIGSLLGGVLGAVIGIEATMWVAVGIEALALVPVLGSVFLRAGDLPVPPSGAGGV